MKRLDQKDKVNFEFYDVTTWLKNNCNHVLPNISRSKENQTMKNDQLIEYILRNIFVEISYTKCDAENVKIEHISGLIV